jgi:hypothetical protein
METQFADILISLVFNYVKIRSQTVMDHSITEDNIVYVLFSDNIQKYS